ncbi:MAG: N-(5'-phosphoribosyl)anthranilate isomerase [Lautropia sp.]
MQGEAIHAEAPAGLPDAGPSEPAAERVRRRTRIKFCGLVRGCDVDTAVALGVDAIGFVFYPPSRRCLDERDAAALRRRLPSFVAAVGLFVDEAAGRVEAVAARVGLDVIQLHGNEQPAYAAAFGPRVWRAHRISPGYDLARETAAWRDAEFHLLDSASPGFGGSGHAFDWSLAQASGLTGLRTLVAGGLDASNVGAAIAALRPFGVDTASGIEGATPRCKDPDRMERFVAAVRTADDAEPRAIRSTRSPR